MLTSLNMVRQGIAVNIFLILTLFPSKKFINIIYLTLGLFLHKVSPLLVFIKQLKNLKIFRYKFLKLALVFLLISVITIYVKLTNNYTNTINPGINLTYIISLFLLIHSTFIYIKRKIIPENIKLITLFYPTIIFTSIIINASYYGERLFVNYLPFIFLSSLYIFKNDSIFRILFIVILSSYVLVSWTIGPLQNAFY